MKAPDTEALASLQEALQPGTFPTPNRKEALMLLWSALIDSGRRDGWVRDRLDMIEDALILEGVTLNRIADEFREIGQLVQEVSPHRPIDFTAHDIIMCIRHHGRLVGIALGHTKILDDGRRCAVFDALLVTSAVDVPVEARSLLLLDWLKLCCERGLAQVVCAFSKTDTGPYVTLVRSIGFVPYHETASHIFMQRELLASLTPLSVAGHGPGSDFSPASAEAVRSEWRA